MNTTGLDCPHCGAADLTDHGEGCPLEKSEKGKPPDPEKKGGLWTSPLKFHGERGMCWVCGRAESTFVGLGTGYYALCMICAGELEVKVLERAASFLEEQLKKIREEMY